MAIRVGIIGARGYVGQELIRIILANDAFELDFVSSRERAGQLLNAFDDTIHSKLAYSLVDVADMATLSVDALVLALPNGLAKQYVDAVDAAGLKICIIDLSADYRFDDTWCYGLPERNRALIANSKRISNPGCYASAMQFAVMPMLQSLDGAVQCFGVSGYSGAGTTASDKNNPEKLKDNLIAYSLTGHIHEREVARHLNADIEFMPHVAAYFRGLSITANMHLKRSYTLDEITKVYAEFYRTEPQVAVKESMPWPSEIANQHGAIVGGFSLSADGRRVVVVSVLDNLLKGAASQAMQNLNIAFGFNELKGLDHE